MSDVVLFAAFGCFVAGAFLLGVWVGHGMETD
jgi:hypothetical protein